MAAEVEVVSPGQRLGELGPFLSGSGTHVLKGKIYASILGVKHLENAGEKPTFSVRGIGEQPLVVPEVGNVVTCKVKSINPRLAKVSIICVGHVPVKDQFRGIIRVQDVRATEKDKVEIYESFRPGDIVLAKVISLGDARSYLLSTAENELGVAYAISTSGYPMTAISWCEMQCDRTGIKVVPAAVHESVIFQENRKVASVWSD